MVIGPAQLAELRSHGSRATHWQVMLTVGVAGFEPAAFRSQSGRATKLRHTPCCMHLDQSGFKRDTVEAVD